MESYSDQQLWRLLKSGDKQAFEIVYRRYVRSLYREISKRIDSPDIAEDLTQDIFLTLWEKRESYQPKGEIFPYLYGMTMNRVLNHYRKNKIQPKFVEIWENLSDEMSDASELSAAFRQTQSEEMETLVVNTISSLPARMLEVYQLRYEKELSIIEIAKTLSTSPNTVHNQLKTIRKRVSEALKNTSYILYLSFLILY
ncbi:sigma-70 family RNA polymerase sigma factor [Albibacterium sp.]|uniref:RNA polymerase sigma factor n=1 Tax=Albibacterium sp. TaxID=2952885 RepID=UPI002C6ED1FD|nr:sigma-70 family RNA polymerase sigma factor [Albibacterium sp.]HUH20094.1 sigma-70 family RNA polymerase sigma factor [Albibacterium sp.]